MKKKIFVTGSMGFVGSHWVKRLVKEGHQVTGLDIKPLDSYFKNLKNFRYIKDLRWAMMNFIRSLVDQGQSQFIRSLKIFGTEFFRARLGRFSRVRNPLECKFGLFQRVFISDGGRLGVPDYIPRCFQFTTLTNEFRVDKRIE